MKPHSKNTWKIAVHGGAGALPLRMSRKRLTEFRDGITQALFAAEKRLEEGGGCIEAVEAAVSVLEDCEPFDAGRGAVFTRTGRHECHAAIMSGANCGAASNLQHVRNPVRLARALLEHAPHVHMVGKGAEAFAREHGLAMVRQDYFSTEERRQEWKHARLSGSIHLDNSPHTLTRGTVGAVAIDRFGKLAAATSTGGLVNQWDGRMPDSPLIGAGTYANDNSCAVSCTGIGERFIRHVAAHQVHARIHFAKESISRASRAVLQAMGENSGGMIVLDRSGKLSMPYNTFSMLRGYATSTGTRRFGIHRELSPF